MQCYSVLLMFRKEKGGRRTTDKSRKGLRLGANGRKGEVAQATSK